MAASSNIELALLKGCLDRLLAETTRQGGSRELRDSINKSLEALAGDNNVAGSSIQSVTSPVFDIGDKHWSPLKLSLAISAPAKVKEVSLDCLQKLFAHKILKGATPIQEMPSVANASSPSASFMSAFIGRSSIEPTAAELSFLDITIPKHQKGRDSSTLYSDDPVLLRESTTVAEPTQPFLIDEIVHTICTSAAQVSKDDFLQLHFMKSLLTMITSSSCEVHSVSLLKVVQTCVQIYVHSKNPTIQATAKASLTQMVNSIISRMENYSDYVEKNPDILEAASQNADEVSSLHAPLLADKPIEKPKSPIAVVQSDAKTEQESTAAEGEADSENPTLKEEATVASAAEPSRNASVVSMIDDVELSETSSPGPGSVAEADRDTISQIASTKSRELTVIIPNYYNPTAKFYLEVLQNDVYHVFRLLCRLSTQSDNDSASSTVFNASAVEAGASQSADELPAHIVRSRILALELILTALNNAGIVLQTNELYFELMRSYLAATISRNAIITHPTLFELSLSVFLMVIRLYRPVMKAEIEVLLNTIYIHILEMTNSTFHQKQLVLQALHKICEDQQTLADLYLNYDCDLNTVSLFERLLSVCSKVAQGNEANLPVPQLTLFGLAASAAGFGSQTDQLRQQEKRLRQWGLICLVSVVRALNIRHSVYSETESKDSTEEHDTSGDIDLPDSAGNLADEEAVTANDRLSHQPTAFASRKSVQDVLSVVSHASPVIINKDHLSNVTLVGNHQRTVSSHSFEAVRAVINLSEEVLSVEELASRKLALKQGLELFNRKPEKGIKYLIKNKFLDEEPVAIAKFLLSTPSLNKSAIGEYLGDGDPFMIKVMHAFIDSLDFVGTDFVTALRGLLQTFRLPGESQKVDRLMEKFADRYCENNPEIFAKADTAYTLAFSIIMLNTDLHSPMIKNKMDCDGFIKNNRGINDNADLPDEYLRDIFEGIQTNEIVMEDEQTGRLAELAKGRGGGELNEQQKLELYKREAAHIQKKSQQLIKAAVSLDKMAPYRAAVQPEFTRSLFSTASWPLMATFSVTFEESTAENLEEIDEAWALIHEAATGLEYPLLNPKLAPDPKLHDLSLCGFAGSVRIASILQMETERDAFITSLSKLTSLSRPNEIKPKNIKAIKVLLDLANSLGEYLDGSWDQILKIVSQMERLQLLGNRGRESVSRASVDTTTSKHDVGPGRTSMAESYTSLKPGPLLDRLLVEFSSQSAIVTVDRIFTTTTSLSGAAILHFFGAVCSISLEEVGLDPSIISAQKSYIKVPNLTSLQSKWEGQPRMYLLQKIVESAYYNMHRIRYEWSQIWRILRPYFNSIGCHPSATVATFAVDSLRQLSMKFLEREELEHYDTQNEFLKSFEFIMKNNTDLNIRELILSSFSQMISARAGSIRSGWKSLFSVLAFTILADNCDERLVHMAFVNLDMIYKEHINVISHAGSFMDYVTCLADFALLKGDGAAHDDVVAGSLQLMQHCARYLIHLAEDEQEAKNIPKKQSADVKSNKPGLLVDGIISEDHFYMKWFPIVAAMTRVAVESESISVRTRVLDVLGDTLRSGAHHFCAKYWKSIFETVFCPILNDIKDKYEAALTSEEAVPTLRDGLPALWIQSLKLVTEAFTDSFDAIVSNEKELLDIVIGMTSSMLKQKDAKLAGSGQICFQQLLQNNFWKFQESSWSSINNAILAAYTATVPAELLTCEIQKTGTGNGIPKTPLSPRMSSSSILNSATSNTAEVSAAIIADGRIAASHVAQKTSLDELDFSHTIIKCVTHVDFLQTLREIGLVRDGRHMLNSNTPTQPRAAITLMPVAVRNQILQTLYDSYAVARAFNEDFELRQAILKKGLVQQMPNLVKQETIALSSRLRLLFAIYKLEGDPEETASTTKSTYTEDELESYRQWISILIRDTLDVIERFVVLVAEQPHNSRDIGLWSPVVILIFKELLSMEGWWDHLRAADGTATNGQKPIPKCLALKKQLPRIFRMGIRMMSVDRHDVRQVLQEFMETVGEELFSRMFSH